MLLPSDSMVPIVHCPIHAFFPIENQLATSQARVATLALEHYSVILLPTNQKSQIGNRRALGIFLL
jgi:hypothetical protein